MKKIFSKLVLACAAIAALFGSNAAKADTIYWNTWTSSSTGSMTVGSTPVTVTFSSPDPHYDIANYPSYTPTSSYVGGIVGNAPDPSNGIMQLFGGTTNKETITFSTPVVNPVMAIWSLGQGGTPAVFDFSTATPVIVAGGLSAEYGGSAITGSGSTISGSEGNGTVAFSGTFTSISFTNPLYEDWYGFNVGAPGIGTTTSAAAVPEPSSFALLGLGGIGLAYGAYRRRRAVV